MTKDDIILTLSNHLELPPEQLSESYNLFSSDGWDSLTINEFISTLAKKFNLILSASEVLECRSIAELISLVFAHQLVE